MAAARLLGKGPGPGQGPGNPPQENDGSEESRTEVRRALRGLCKCREQRNSYLQKSFLSFFSPWKEAGNVGNNAPGGINVSIGSSPPLVFFI